MRPIKLTLSGWGPYAVCEVVDFDAFGREGLFLITGATGGGKTTIFDGITYALYGETSGTTREKDFLRSDFAKPDTDTFVELIFTHKGEEYKVMRSPRYSRPKKRGQGEVVTSETAVLYEEGKMPVTALKDVNRRLGEIMGISYKQFKQIAMIAQGEFLDLLLANSKDRVEIFRNLFGTEEQERFQKKLSEKVKIANAALTENKHKMSETLSQIQTERKLIEEELSKDYINLERLAEEVGEEIKEDKEAVKQFGEELKKLEKKLKKLTEKNQEYASLEKRIEANGKKLLICEREKEDSERKKEQAIKAAKLEEESFLERKKQLEEKQREEKEQLELLKKHLLEYDNLEEQVSEVKLYIARLTEKIERYKEIEKKEKSIETLAENLREKQNEYKQAENLCAEIKKVYEEKDGAYRAAAIGLAARYLEAGKPCPVCGATTHPSPAIVSDAVPDKKEVEIWKEKWQQAEERKNEIFQKAAQAKGSLDAMKEEVEDAFKMLKNESGSYEELILEEKEKKGKQKQLEKQIKEKKKLQKEKEEKEQAQADFWMEREELEKQHEKRIQQVKKEEELQKLLAEGKRTLLQELQKEKTVLEKEIAAFEEKLCRDSIFAEFVSEELKDINVQVIKTAMLAIEKEKKFLQREKEEKIVKITVNEKALHSISEKQKERNILEERYSLIRGLEQIATGKNKDRMVFEQYVLSAYFEDIVAAANLRLGKMTGGRYQLSRVEKVADGRTTDSLNLEVLDHFTGKKRPVKTLSGGESFKAALSLALGLSDVVQAYAGGIQIETLFIDEGFGALDEESLEQAMSTLDGLTEHNRLIGIISHVTELKERIDKKIVVEKGRSGSHIYQE